MWTDVKIDLFSDNPKNRGVYFYTVGNLEDFPAAYKAKLPKLLLNPITLQTLAPIAGAGILSLKVSTINAFLCQYISLTFKDEDDGLGLTYIFFYEVIDVTPAEVNGYFNFNLRIDYWHTFINQANIKLLQINACSANFENIPFTYPEISASFINSEDKYVRAISNEVTETAYSLIAKVNYINSETRNNTASAVEMFVISRTITLENGSVYVPPIPELVLYIGNIFAIKDGNQEHKAQVSDIFLIPISPTTETMVTNFITFSGTGNKNLTLSAYKIKGTELNKTYKTNLSATDLLGVKYIKIGTYYLSLPQYITNFECALFFNFAANDFSARLRIGQEIDEEITETMRCQVITAENHTALEAIADGINSTINIISGIAGIASASASGNIAGVIQGVSSGIGGLASEVLKNYPQRTPAQASGKANGLSILIPDTIGGIDNVAFLKLVTYTNDTYTEQAQEYIKFNGAECNFYPNTQSLSGYQIKYFEEFFKEFCSATKKLYNETSTIKALSLRASAYVTGLNTNIGLQILNDLNNGVYIVDITNYAQSFN